MTYNPCPRCGTRSYENLATHSYCLDCNYFPEQTAYDQWRKLEFRKPKISLRPTEHMLNRYHSVLRMGL